MGSSSFTISSITLTGTNAGDFAQTHTCGSSLGAGASCTISVTFTSAAINSRTAALTINDTGGGNSQSGA